MLLSGKPVLMHTISNFSEADKIILVLPAEHISAWTGICKKYNFKVTHQVVAGGTTRFESVKKGLDSVGDKLKNAVVAIHDGVRPLASSKLVAKCYQEAEKFGSAVPCIPLNESLRKTEAGRSISVERNKYVLVQTPQCFSADILMQAYSQSYEPSFTDDATVVEANGHQIHLVEGEKQNIKITYAEDMVIAEAFLKSL